MWFLGISNFVGNPTCWRPGDFLGACYRKAMTPQRLWTLLLFPRNLKRRVKRRVWKFPETSMKHFKPSSVAWSFSPALSHSFAPSISNATSSAISNFFSQRESAGLAVDSSMDSSPRTHNESGISTTIVTTSITNQKKKKTWWTMSCNWIILDRILTVEDSKRVKYIFFLGALP